MDETELRLLATRALYGGNLEERSSAIRQLHLADLSERDIAALGVRLELALNCQDEYVRSAAALLLAGLAERVPTTPALAAGLLDLSHSADPFPREAALRAIQRIRARGRVVFPRDEQALQERLAEALQVEREVFALSLLDDLP